MPPTQRLLDATENMNLRRTIDQLWEAVHRLEDSVKTQTAQLTAQQAQIDATLTAVETLETTLRDVEAQVKAGAVAGGEP